MPKTALDVLSHETARQVLAHYASQGYDVQAVAERVAKKLNDEQDAKYRRLLADSKRIRTADKTAHRTMKVCGMEVRKTFEIPLESFQYWSRRLGEECWQDAGFVREILRDNPEWKVEYARESRITAGIAFDASGAAVA